MNQQSNSENTTTEQWAIINDFPSYSISNLGNVVNNMTGELVRKFQNRERKTLYVKLKMNNHYYRKQVDKLVAKHFMAKPNFKSWKLIHLDHNATNSNVNNLKWMNGNDAWEHQNNNKYSHQFFNWEEQLWESWFYMDNLYISALYDTLEEAYAEYVEKINEVNEWFQDDPNVDMTSLIVDTILHNQQQEQENEQTVV